ncbi:MAG TPA: 2-oxo acid dehydrogenase subunit E2, partial [Solirubrobacterales bacterium]
VNSSWRDEKIEMYERVNVGVAVAKGDELIVPVIGDADRLSLVQIAERSRLLVEAVKDGTVTPAQLEGGTFSVSNLGMFEVDEFEAILNTPQAAILAVGAIRREPAFDDAGGATVGRPMRVTLTCDHRVIYGAHGAAFLQSLRRYLEEPLRLLLSGDARAVGA